MTNRTHILPSANTRKLRQATCAFAFVCALTAFTLRPCQAQTFTVIHNFTGAGDGSVPHAGVTVDRAGNLYGTTFSGGASTNGVVYLLKQRNESWTLNPLYSFAGGNDGANPYGRVAIASDGTLYGTTYLGGGGPCMGGCGTVFHLTPSASAPRSVLQPWNEGVLLRFFGVGYSGGNPQGDLIFDNSGNIYGTTIAGGNDEDGLVYELTNSDGTWTESVLYLASGDGRQGNFPYGGVILDSAGNLYGTTSNGGYGGAGTAYQLSPAGSGWTELTIHQFYGPDGATPLAGLILDQAGNLYGTTSSGGDGYGTVFELTFANGDWVFNTLYQFESGLANGGPQDRLAMDTAGNLYGTTFAGGANGYGSIFKLTNSNGQWTYSSLHDFTGGDDGANPISTVVFDASGNLYGTASAGGSGSECQRGCGVVWEITP